MKKETTKPLLMIIGALIFNIIFWNEKAGINVAIFDVFIISCIFSIYPNSVKNIFSRWLLFFHVITLFALIVQNTFLSEIAFIITLLLFVSFSQYLHRSVLYASGSVIFNYLYALPNFIKAIKVSSVRNIRIKHLLSSIRIFIIPAILLLLFICIYSFANVVFSDIFSAVLTALEKYFANFFYWFSVARFAFFLFGFFVTGGMIMANHKSWFSALDMRKENKLVRIKGGIKKWKKTSFSDLISVLTGKDSSGILALKNEYTVGLISIALLNILLLFINAIDIRYVWLRKTFNKWAEMASYVHEGAGLLILSIVLAMLLLLFFFRSNLNFYKRNKWLKYGASLWIVQNLFLAASVFLRNYYYISHFGLAYKRIGLLFFLAMVLIGLITIFLKIHFTRTTYYLLRVNGWIAIFFLVFASVINWDVTIANYNLKRKSSIPVDVHFLLSLSNSTLPIIEENKDVLANKTEGRTTALDFFEIRKRDFQSQQQAYSWLSWNIADAQVLKKINFYPGISSVK